MTGPSGRRRQRDSKALLEAAARAEFAECGYAGARVDRIAKRAGVNKQLVFYYFRSKQGLYDSIIERVAGEAMQQPETGSKARHASESLREAFSALFDSLAVRTELARLLVLETRRPARGTYGRTLARFMSHIREVVVEGQAHGYFRDDIDPDRAAQQAVILALGYIAFERFREIPSDPASARTWRDTTADLLVRALAW
ncbi:MAG: TetR/AcrR family transcriptional regulator [Gemmatimonadetes bacterium]|nr:TetR/AcrR family transcriptional regulator [Gemmatimonadota bacterium]